MMQSRPVLSYACKVHTSACGLRHCGLSPFNMTRAQLSYVISPWWQVLSVSLLMENNSRPANR